MLSRSWKVAIALGTVYIIWGSTYLAIRISIETIPPLLMGGLRFTLAGSIIYAWAAARGAPRPNRTHLNTALIAGVLMLGGGNGGVIWAEQFIPSGAAALVVATVPLWITLVDWARPSGVQPRPLVVVGLLAGFAGTAFLIVPADMVGSGLDPVAVMVVVGAAISWAFGSVFTRHATQHPVPAAAIGLNMILGGLALTLGGTVAGEWASLDLAAISTRSAVAWVYLVFFGAIVAYSAYLWLLRNVNLATASTYAYVNPIVAVVLGWALANEALTVRMQLATVVIVGGVVAITTGGRVRPAR